jgi:hypothetical protein
MAETACRRRRVSAFVLLGLSLASPAQARTMTFGDLEITVASEPKGSSSHGYFEYLFVVVNKSKERPHTVSLSIPFEKTFSNDDTIRDLRRTVQVGANETVHVSLWQPDYPPIGGVDVAVTIDGHRQDREMQWGPNQTYFTRRGSYYGHGYSGYSFGSPDPLVLIGPRSKTLLEREAPAPGGMAGMPPGLAPGMPMGPARGSASPSRSQPFVRADAWSANWLSYSRYDGIALSGDELNALPPNARTALWQYVETGGALFVVGRADLRGLSAVTATTEDEAGWTTVKAGFGQCIISPNANSDEWDAKYHGMLSKAWADAASAWQGRRSTYDANQEFPVVEDLGIPVKGLFVLMFLFVLTIGPINFLVVSRLKRRIWLLWTTPLISLATCLLVFGYMLLSEGWEGQLRSATLTLLDETTQRATTIGWTGVYSPLTPSDGLHFSYETEVIPQRFYEGRGGGARSCTLDWSRDQHFDSGWIEARVPAHFKVRKSEMRRERVALERQPDGRWSMVNLLGSAIQRFWYADDKGAIHVAENVAPGARTTLKLTEKQSEAATTSILSLGGEWMSSMQLLTANPQRYVRPGGYLAELDDSPFLEDALRNAKKRKLHALVLGFRSKNEKGE